MQNISKCKYNINFYTALLETKVAQIFTLHWCSKILNQNKCFLTSGPEHKEFEADDDFCICDSSVSMVLGDAKFPWDCAQGWLFTWLQSLHWIRRDLWAFIEMLQNVSSILPNYHIAGAD